MMTGSMVALVTPMTNTGEIDWPSLDRLLDWHLEEGTDAIVAVGTTGECATLSVEEHLQVVKVSVDKIAGRIPVIAGTGANNTREAISLTQQAKELGADAVLLVTPYYNRPTQHGMYQHFASIANAVGIPQILYNVPKRTGVDLLPETVKELAQVENIVGLKEATGDLLRAKALLECCPNDFALYSGDDDTAADFMLLGGKGVISVAANVVPKKMAELCQAALKKEVSSTRAFNEQMLSLQKAMSCEANPIPVKWALAKMGYMQDGIRLPLTSLSASYHDQVTKALKDNNLL